MAKAKAKKLKLPKNFEALLEKGNLDRLKAVFDKCDVNATGGDGEQTALAFEQCPDALARWLVEQGADLSATDMYGKTPLHNRASYWQGRIEVLLELGADVDIRDSSGDTPLHAAAGVYNTKNAQLLLEYGARLDPYNHERLTPLELALRGCENAFIERMAELAKLFLDEGAKRTARMKGFVKEIGKSFELYRSHFNPASVAATSKALNQLYKIFDVEPVPQRAMHDFKAKITVKTKTWQKQHQELWELLVPAIGRAATVQGEVIRLSGCIASEIEGNGGANWNADYKKMATALFKHFKSGASLSSEDLEVADSVAAEVKCGGGEANCLGRLAVVWVLRNPQPVTLQPPSYRR